MTDQTTSQTETEASPAPWTHGRNHVGTGTVLIRDALGDAVGYATCARHMYGHKQNDAEALANAKKMAAAPQLRAALLALADILEHECDCPPCTGSYAPAEHALGVARDLLAATGPAEPEADSGRTFDYDAIAEATGYTVEDVKMYGIAHCENNPLIAGLPVECGYRPTDTGNWQFIIRTVEGLDYCRETMPSGHTRASAFFLLSEMIKNNPDRSRFGSIRVERW